MSYAVYFSGEIAEGHTLESVRARLGEMFKVQESQRLDPFFSGKRMLIKGGLSAEQASKYQASLLAAGAVCEVVNTDAPVTQKDADPAPLKRELSLIPTHEELTATAAPASASQEPASGSPFPTAAQAVGASPVVDKPWWIERHGDRLGPHSREELLALAGAGELHSGDLLWKAGLPNAVKPASLSWLAPAITSLKQTPTGIAAARRIAQRSDAGPGNLVRNSIIVGSLAWFVGMPLVIYKVNDMLSDYTVAPSIRQFYLGIWYVLPGFTMLYEHYFNQAKGGRLLSWMLRSMALSGIILALASQGIMVGSHRNSDRALFPDELTALAARFNEKAPEQVGDDMQMDGATYANNVFHVRFSLLHETAAQANKDALVRHADDLARNSLCTTKQFRQSLKQGLTLSYEFSGKDKLPIVTVPESYSACTSVVAATNTPESFAAGATASSGAAPAAAVAASAAQEASSADSAAPLGASAAVTVNSGVTLEAAK